MESHSGEAVGRNIVGRVVVVSVVVEVVEASVTGVIIWMLTVSAVVVALITVVMVLILSAEVVVVGAAVVHVVELGNIPAPDPSPREFYGYIWYLNLLYDHTPSEVASIMMHSLLVTLSLSGISQQNNPVGILALFLRFRRTTP